MEEKPEKRSAEEGRETEIRFGTLIKIKSEIAPNRIDVIDDVGGESFEGFYSGELHDPDDEERRWFRLGGTTTPDQVEAIVGQLSEEQVTAAAERGWRRYVSKKSSPESIEEGLEIMRQHLKEVAKKEPRKIKITG